MAPDQPWDQFTDLDEDGTEGIMELRLDIQASSANVIPVLRNVVITVCCRPSKYSNAKYTIKISALIFKKDCNFL